ncbi:MAG: polymer-forming cytoskeletal protein [Myxococcales bacterium]|nr:polymer-forming cytoskeletal protein [Myxococcales bacterium]
MATLINPPSSNRGANETLNALLGKGSEFEGKLTFEGTVRIDGTFSGEIFTEDKLIVGEGAVVRAQIDAGSVEIHGDVIGDIRANESIELRSPARLKGNIATPALSIDKGVIFDGQCNMTTKEGTNVKALRAFKDESVA